MSFRIPGVLAAVLVAHAASAADIVVLSEHPAPPTALVRFDSPTEDVRIGVVRATDTQRAGEVTLVSKYYEELCVAPCVVALEAGWYEFHLAHRKLEWTKRIEVEPGAQQIRIRPPTQVGIVGAYFTASVVLAPVGIPMLIAGHMSVRRTEWEDAPALISAASGAATTL